MEDDIERLRMILGEHDVWQGPFDSEAPPRPQVSQEIDFYSSLDEDEVFLSGEHSKGGRLEDTIGYNPVHDFPGHNLEVGQEAPEGELFCTLKAVARYPYNYICAASRDGVVRQFFAGNRIYERVWDLFYIHPPPSVGYQALLLVPSAQVQHLLATINDVRKTSLKLPDSAIEAGLVFDFPKDGTPRPRYLGRTQGKEMADQLKQAIPSSSYRPDNEHGAGLKPTDESLAAFKLKIESMLDADKKKKAAAKGKKKVERIAKQQAWNHIIKRVQRYLGVRKARHELAEVVVDRNVDQSLGSTDVDSIQLDSITIESEVNTPRIFDVNSLIPFTQEGSVVFICIDVEAYERDHRILTEIGIATLDTADITAIPAGENGINWRNAIRAQHFRISEYENLKNTQYLNGCPENFIFGKSKWISIKDAPNEISKCFNPPYSAEAKECVSKEPAEETVTDDDDKEPAQRSIVLVGHNLGADIGFLKEIGFNLYNLPNLHELVDTVFMYQALKREPTPRNLGCILANLDIPGWHLHNAGNDATYTLQAMIGIAIRALQERQDRESRKEENKARIAECVKAAADAAMEAQLGWSSDGSDGGAAVPPPPSIAALCPKAPAAKAHQNFFAPWTDEATDTQVSRATGGEKEVKGEKW